MEGATNAAKAVNIGVLTVAAATTTIETRTTDAVFSLAI